MASRTVSTTQGALTATELRDRLIAQAVDEEDFRDRLLADPGAVLRDDYGIALPENLKLCVHEENATTAHLVLPRSKKLSDAELEATSAGGYY